MPSVLLSSFENLPPEAIELLEAAGHTDIKSVFEHSYEEIKQELIRANSVLEIVDGDIDDNRLPNWLKTIEQQAGKEFSKGQVMPNNVATPNPETKPQAPSSQVEERVHSNLISRLEIQQAPVAIPLSKEFIAHYNLNIAALPQGAVRPIDTSTSASNIPASVQQSSPSQLVQSTTLFGNASTNTKPASLDKSRILSMDKYKQEGSSVAVQPEAPKVNNLTRTTRKETNEGVSPESKFFIKGVLHQDIPKFKTGSYSFLLFNLIILMVIVVTPLAIIDKEKYWWCIFAPALLLPAVFIYFTACQKASCPICTQKQYALKRCLKHKNAHRWPIFGYMLPTCLHALFFKWFRCIFCGTSVRIKE